jgi:hypothetical protein
MRNEQKDCNEKPDPQGNALIIKIKYKIALRIEVEILFEERKKIATESLTRRVTPKTFIKAKKATP